MAFSATKKTEENVGAKKLQVVDASFASVTVGHYKSGFNNVVGAHFQNQTTAGAVIVKPNTASDGTTFEAGGVYLAGATSNDLGQLFVYGN